MYAILAALTFLGLFFTLLGVFVVFHVFRPQKPPADTSNRINKIRLFWFALTREDLFTDTFPWLKNDELDNVTQFKVETIWDFTQMKNGHHSLTGIKFNSHHDMDPMAIAAFNASVLADNPDMAADTRKDAYIEITPADFSGPNLCPQINAETLELNWYVKKNWAKK